MRMRILLFGANIQNKDGKCFIGREELIRQIVEKGHELIVLGVVPEAICYSKMIELGVKYIELKYKKSIAEPFNQLSVLKGLVKLFRNLKPDMLLVYSIQYIPLMVIAAKISKIKRINVVVTGSGRLFQIKGVKGVILRAPILPVLKYCFSNSENIFVQNKDDIEMLTNMKLIDPKKAILVNGSGVNLEKFSYEKLETKPVFSMISRLIGLKGVNEFVKAACYVKRIYPHAIFNLIGPLSEDDPSINIIELNKAAENGVINLRGEVNDVRPYLRETRVFILPSYYPEGVPRSILEAMAMGRPIITTNSQGCRETVLNGINGFLVQPRNAEELAEKIIWMIENEEKVEEMGKQSRKICEEKFDVKAINKKMIEIMKL